MVFCLRDKAAVMGAPGGEPQSGAKFSQMQHDFEAAKTM
jgi:hypothetical protein